LLQFLQICWYLQSASKFLTGSKVELVTDFGFVVGLVRGWFLEIHLFGVRFDTIWDSNGGIKSGEFVEVSE
jgi:hypothetical protein